MKRMTFEDIRRSIDSAAGLLLEAGKLQEAELVKQYLPQIFDITSKIVAPLEDGLQLTDLEALARTVKPLMVLIGQVTTLPGVRKKQFVKEAVWVIYRAYDGGPDGKENNINIPWLPTNIEQRLEAIVVPMVASLIIEALFPVLKGSGDIR